MHFCHSISNGVANAIAYERHVVEGYRATFNEDI